MRDRLDRSDDWQWRTGEPVIYFLTGLFLVGGIFAVVACL